MGGPVTRPFVLVSGIGERLAVNRFDSRCLVIGQRGEFLLLADGAAPPLDAVLGRMLALDGEAGPGVFQQQEGRRARQQVARDRRDDILRARPRSMAMKRSSVSVRNTSGQNSGVPGRLFFTRCRDEVSAWTAYCRSGSTTCT